MPEILKIDKKEALLDSAERLFADLGYEGASTRRLATEAGVNIAMLNYYFGSKEGLFRAVVERRLATFRQTLINLNEENISPWDKLYRCMELYVTRMVSNTHFHRLIHRELSVEQRSEMSDFITEGLLRNIEEVKRIIEEGIAIGAFRKVDVEMTVASIFGTNYYVLNANAISSKMLGENLNDPEVRNQKIKPRLTGFLHDFLHAHLRLNEKK
ncbi:MAG: TetR/AcrR family transcriptional regulator [Sphingobacteriaceae bacterium]